MVQMPENVKKGNNRQKLTGCRKGRSENLGHFERGVGTQGVVLERGGLTPLETIWLFHCDQNNIYEMTMNAYHARKIYEKPQRTFFEVPGRFYCKGQDGSKILSLIIDSWLFYLGVGNNIYMQVYGRHVHCHWFVYILAFDLDSCAFQ